MDKRSRTSPYANKLRHLACQQKWHKLHHLSPMTVSITWRAEVFPNTWIWIHITDGLTLTNMIQKVPFALIFFFSQFREWTGLSFCCLMQNNVKTRKREFLTITPSPQHCPKPPHDIPSTETFPWSKLTTTSTTLPSHYKDGKFQDKISNKRKKKTQ